ncbi:MAG TPA: 4a-hydroxytetrahydrobiopterin dehydratase [Candidatus Angelobacter sp.]|nr:4a-hydroxytetrahydrobiopterin dehydratase [Candidatus Angelobacter sp.]
MAVLTDPQIKQEITKLAGWKHDKTIYRTFEFPDFKGAIRFVNRVAEAAEEANHHPDIDIRYNKVTMSLISHDSGGITQRDVRMAGKINQIAAD